MFEQYDLVQNKNTVLIGKMRMMAKAGGFDGPNTSFHKELDSLKAPSLLSWMSTRSRSDGSRYAFEHRRAYDMLREESNSCDVDNVFIWTSGHDLRAPCCGIDAA